MSKIRAVEDALFTRIRELLDERVKTVDWGPPDFDEDFLKRALKGLPAVFVVFSGGARNDNSEQSLLLDTGWSIVAVTKHSSSAKARARGDATAIGCYEILEVLAPGLDGLCVGNGSMKCVSWENNDAFKLEGEGLMIQSLQFEIDPIELTLEKGTDLLTPFKTFHAKYDLGQPDRAPTAEDDVELTQ